MEIIRSALNSSSGVRAPDTWPGTQTPIVHLNSDDKEMINQFVINCVSESLMRATFSDCNIAYRAFFAYFSRVTFRCLFVATMHHTALAVG